MPVQPYAAALVRGVATHSERIDELISWNLVDWTLERMPAVDRNILRIGVYELLWADDVPDGVAISEAVAAGPGPVDRQLAVVRERRAGPIKADKPTCPSTRTRPHVEEPAGRAREDPSGDDEDAIEPAP